MFFQWSAARDECLRRTRHEMRDGHVQRFGEPEQLKSRDTPPARLHSHDHGPVQTDLLGEIPLTHTGGMPRLGDSLAHLGPALRTSTHV